VGHRDEPSECHGELGGFRKETGLFSFPIAKVAGEAGVGQLLSLTQGSKKRDHPHFTAGLLRADDHRDYVVTKMPGALPLREFPGAEPLPDDPSMKFRGEAKAMSIGGGSFEESF